MDEDVWKKLEEKAKTDADKLVLQRISVTLAELAGAFMTTFLHQTPKKALDSIRRARISAKDPLFPPSLSELLSMDLDRKEIELYHLIFPLELYAELTSGRFELRTPPDKDTLAKVRAELLEVLREAVSRLPKNVCETPIGYKITRKRRKGDGASPKNWPIVTSCILEIYKLIRHLYIDRECRSPYGTKPGRTGYPQEMLQDIVALVESVVGDHLHDLDVRDVQSRIQYGFRRGILKP